MLSILISSLSVIVGFLVIGSMLFLALASILLCRILSVSEGTLFPSAAAVLPITFFYVPCGIFDIPSHGYSSLDWLRVVTASGLYGNCC
jgi:hypothetical protein